MVAGHLDEIGFMITQIDDRGFLKFQPLGGWWEQVMLAQRVTVMTNKGNITGVIGSKPPHILPADQRKKMVEKKKTCSLILVRVIAKKRSHLVCAQEILSYPFVILRS